MDIREVRSVHHALPPLALLGVATRNVTWQTPFADANYTVAVTQIGGSGITMNLQIQVTGKTAAGCAIQVTAAAALSAGASLDVTATHD